MSSNGFYVFSGKNGLSFVRYDCDWPFLWNNSVQQGLCITAQVNLSLSLSSHRCSSHLNKWNGLNLHPAVFRVVEHVHLITRALKHIKTLPEICK